MTHRTRRLSLLVVSQAICLAVGLWLQNRFVIAIATWEDPTTSNSIDPIDFETSLATDSPMDMAAGKQEFSAENLQGAMITALPFGFIWIIGLQTIVAYLVMTRLQLTHSQKETRSQEASLTRAKELIRTRDAVTFGLAKLAESRDPDTGHHLERIALYSTRLATALRRDRRYRNAVSPNFVRSIGISSALHDIGKVGVIDSILLKPGELTTIERIAMQKHANIGGDCIRQIEQRLGNSEFLAMAREIAYYHHERWDGAGYPANLKGEQIPLAARIVAIADVYDALASRRAYKCAFPHQQCVDLIRKEAGRHFDPHLVAVFLSIEDQFYNIMKRFREEPKLDPDISRGTAFGDADKTFQKEIDGAYSETTDDVLIAT